MHETLEQTLGNIKMQIFHGTAYTYFGPCGYKHSFDMHHKVGKLPFVRNPAVAKHETWKNDGNWFQCFNLQRGPFLLRVSLLVMLSMFGVAKAINKDEVPLNVI